MYDWGRYRIPAPQAYVGSGAECREGVGGGVARVAKLYMIMWLVCCPPTV